MKRSELFEQICAGITTRSHTVRVAIDGVDCAGKTTFADELGGFMESKGRNVIRASIDGFHNPPEVRYEMGKDSPEGYYLKSFNYDAIIQKLLKPLGPGGNKKYITAVYDFRTEKEVRGEIRTAPENCVLIFEGVFLMRPELKDLWDHKIWLDVSFNTVLERAMKRDLYLFGNEDKIKEKYLKRYIPGQKIYLDKIDPVSVVDTAIDNSNPSEPVQREGPDI